MSVSSIAVIGAGPSGLAVAKHLLEEGLAPVVFEQSNDLGGQWNATAEHSGIWPGMPANTSRVTTRFSDFPHDEDIPMFPSNTEVLDYLRRYAVHFGVEPCLRPGTQVLGIERAGAGWQVRFQKGKDAPQVQQFSHVVAASGRYNKPAIPRLPGLEQFERQHRVLHSFDYAGAASLAGQRVLVVGNSISALEISADLAADAGIEVISSCRKPRYILSKILGGMPADCVAFTRFANLAFRALPPPEAAEGLKQLILRFCGNPAQYGGLRPADSILEANASQCQNYLPFVAEGRITVKSAPVAFTEHAVEFQDGTCAEIDAVIFATGFDLNLPYLGDESAAILNVDQTNLDLFGHSFHPDLPGLFFLGMYSQVGPYLPVVELQARWVAALISGAQSMPSSAEMRRGIEAHQAWRQEFHEVLFHDMAVLFSNLAEVSPKIAQRPELARALLFGPLSPTQFRMDGRGRDPGAEEAFVEEASRFVKDATAELEAEQRGALQMLAANLEDEQWLQELAAAVA